MFTFDFIGGRFSDMYVSAKLLNTINCFIYEQVLYFMIFWISKYIQIQVLVSQQLPFIFSWSYIYESPEFASQHIYKYLKMGKTLDNFCCILYFAAACFDM